MKFRIARHTNQLETIVNFYINDVGLDKLGEFENHDGYNGVFMAKSNKDWHLEFTSSSSNTNHTFDDDDILVFYPENKIDFDALVSRINANQIKIKIKIKIKILKNPYWNNNRIAFSDPDGFNIIVSPLKII